MKLKWSGGTGEWEKEICNCLSNIGSSIEELSNLQITVDAVVENLIIESFAVIAFGSTTMIEALMVGKPVITMSYAEAAENLSVILGRRVNRQTVSRYYRGWLKYELTN